eukprot:6201136-Pleurochrysis_carterae.AAC.3
MATSTRVPVLRAVLACARCPRMGASTLGVHVLACVRVAAALGVSARARCFAAPQAPRSSAAVPWRSLWQVKKRNGETLGETLYAMKARRMTARH